MHVILNEIMSAKKKTNYNETKMKNISFKLSCIAFILKRAFKLYNALFSFWSIVNLNIKKQWPKKATKKDFKTKLTICLKIKLSININVIIID